MNHFAIDDKLRGSIEDTGYLHRPLPLWQENSLEQMGLKKAVLEQRVLCDMQTAEGWQNVGAGCLAHNGRKTPGGHTSMRMLVPTRGTGWPEENPEGDYTPFMRQAAMFAVDNEDWTSYNRLHFWIYPDCEGAHVVSLEMVYTNDGEEKVPDTYFREGRHEVNLVNRKWNECFLEIPELPRDRMTSIGFERAVFGRDNTMGEMWRFDLGEITLQQVENPEVAHGWKPGTNCIAHSMSGYDAKGPKTAVAHFGGGEPPAFGVKNAAGETVMEGIAGLQAMAGETVAVLDFSELQTPGRYTLHCGEAQTRPFTIGDELWGASVWKALNFVFCERCGTPVAGMHGSCHGDILAEHNGVKLAYCGGWHDAGDLSQQTLQTADVTYALLEMAEKAKDSDKQLYLRLLEEAEGGIDFLLKCRFGDGYYASSAGLVHWSDGLIGNFDDRPARAHNNSFDNFLYAACYARAAATLTDAPLREKLARVAREDFAFGMATYEERGFAEEPIPWEHSYNTSPSQYMATMSFAASMLYRLTNEEEYARRAATAMEYVLGCQRTRPIGGNGICGFFYRDETKRVIQHFNHQSRDGVYMQALAALLEGQPQHASRGEWLGAMRLYGEYLKKAAAYTKPWGLLPSGVYHADEAEDAESFTRQHLHASETAKEEYRAQVKAGIQLDEGHWLRIFPVWLSFRGNAAVHLATGKAAAVCARVLGDAALADIAREQLYWIVGKNPFGQSLMYGEGYNYPEQAVFLPGTMAGQLPVGVQTRGNEDVPYWPQANNATYKEAWLTVAGKWFSLVAELT